MSEYIANIGSRITTEATLMNIFEYVDYKFSYSGTTHYTYIMNDFEGNVLIWKTTSSLMFWDEEERKNDVIRKGDIISITGTVKDHNEYQNIKQTVLNRCKISLVSHAPTKEEIESQKREEQIATITGNDLVWKMSYKQYKEHYSDCETIIGSFKKSAYEAPTIEVIIRDGRLKKSGVRGKKFSRYIFESPDGITIAYRAVSEENARKQMKKDFPNSENWELK